MAGDDKKGTALAVGGGAALGTALGLLLTRSAEAKPPAGEVSLDEAAMLLLQSIAQSGVSIDTDTTEIIDVLKQIAAALGVSILENPPEITAFRILVPTGGTALVPALGTPVQLPDRPIPYDKELVIKAGPGNLGTIYVANNRADALNINSCYSLIANEAIEYKIKNANHIWINTTVAGEGVVCTAEKEASPTIA